MTDDVNDGNWRRGYPPMDYYPGMTDDYEVYFTVCGGPWYRRNIPIEEMKRRAIDEGEQR